MIREDAYSRLFLIAALFNWVVAASLALAGDAVWSLLGMGPPADRLTFHLFILFVALFGAGYYWVSRDVTRNHALIGLGAIGKVSFFCVLLGHALAGTTPYTPLLLAAGDLLFAALFVQFLIRVRSEQPTT